MSTQTTGKIRPESNQRPSAQSEQTTIFTAIQSKFASLSRSYGMVTHEVEHNDLRGSSLVCLQSDAEELAQLAQQMRGQLCAGGAA